MASHLLVWQSTGSAGLEMAAVQLGAGSMSARGSVIATHPEPCVISYQLETGPGYITSSLNVSAWGSGWSRTLELRRRHDDVWIARPGGYLQALDAALDCDLAGCCLTNTMPVLRHGLHERPGSVEFLMAWISVPDLVVHTSHQRYTHLTRRPTGGASIRFQSGTFTADLTIDARGFVVDYPGLAERVG
jgi:uncharacterized protein